MRFVHHVKPLLGRKAVINGSGHRLLVASPDSVKLLKRFEIGDLLVGRVSKFLDNSRILFNFRGVELVATTTFPVPEGTEIKGVVQAKGPPLVLRILQEHLPDKSRIFLRFKSLVSEMFPTAKDHPLITLLKTQGITKSEWAKPLARWLTAFVPGEETAINPQSIREALIHGGLFFERKLQQWGAAGGRGGFPEIEADLKGIALKLLSQMQSDARGGSFPPEKAMKLLGSLVDRIELFQTANWLAQEEGLGFVFQIPLRFGETLGTGDVFVGFLNRKREKREVLQVLFLLDLEGLGHFEIDAQISRSGVSAGIGVDRREALALVRSMEGELKESLEKHGLTVVEIECFLLKKRQSTEDLFDRLLVMDEVEAVNIRV